MKYLKIFAVAIIALFGIETAKAQVVVNARIGTPVRPRTVVVERPVHRADYYRPAYRRTAVYHRRPVVYHRPAYRRTVVVNRPVYRHPARRVVVRHY